MPTTIEWFNFFYPYFSDPTDKRFIGFAARDTAIQIGETKTPVCEVVPADSDAHREAVAHYAAHILDGIYYQKAALAPVGTFVKREKDGEVEREFAQAPTIGSVANPANETPLNRYLEIAKLCPTGGLRLKVRRA